MTKGLENTDQMIAKELYFYTSLIIKNAGWVKQVP